MALVKVLGVLLVVVVASSDFNCPNTPLCEHCTRNYRCVFVKLRSGINLCIPPFTNLPEGDYLIFQASTPFQCFSEIPTNAINPKKIIKPSQEPLTVYFEIRKNTGEASDSVEDKNENENEGRIMQESTASHVEDSSTGFSGWEIFLGVITVLAFIFSAVDMVLRCHKTFSRAHNENAEEEQRGFEYVRFYDHDSIDSFPL